MSFKRHATLGVLLAAFAAAPTLPARNFANVAKEWMLVDATESWALYLLLTPDPSPGLRSFGMAMYFVLESSEPAARPYRRATGTATVDCKKRLLGMKFTRANRPDGRTDDIVLLDKPLAPLSSDARDGKIFAFACGETKPPSEKLGSLRSWEGAVASGLRANGYAVRADDEIVERCAVLVDSTNPDPIGGVFQKDVFITRELTFQPVHPGKGFAAYVEGKTGAPVKSMTCDLLDADQPETEQQFLERKFGEIGTRARVVDNSWRP